MGLYKFFVILAKIILNIFYRIEVQGRENAPESGALVCSNHISAWDPIFISTFYPHPIKWMAKHELFESKFLAKLLNHLGAFPVQRDKNDLTALKKAIRLAKKGDNVGIFPEGTRVKERDKNLVKPGIGLLALKTQGQVSPVTILGNYKIFSKMKIIIHPAIDAQDLVQAKDKGQDLYQEVAWAIMDEIYRV